LVDEEVLVASPVNLVLAYARLTTFNAISAELSGAAPDDGNPSVGE